MEEKRKGYSEEFRRKTIERLEQTNKTVTQFAGTGHRSNDVEQRKRPLLDYERLKKLEEHCRELQEKNEIFIKAMHFFSSSLKRELAYRLKLRTRKQALAAVYGSLVKLLFFALQIGNFLNLRD